MEIQKVGEFGLIDRLTKDIKPQNVSTKYGVGDDCAVLHYPESEVLVTTDMLMEGVHFDLTYIDPATPGLQIGYGEHQRHLCHERHTQTDDGLDGPEQAIQRGRYGDVL